MTEPVLTPDAAIAEAVRIVDAGVDYGDMGIDAPADVGHRAAAVLAPVLARHPADLRLRCLYSAALSLAGRLADAREELGKVLEADPAYFEAVAELDHPTAWRHVFLSPPWSASSTVLPPLARRWAQSAEGLKFVSFREGAERVVSLLALAPPELAAIPRLADAPAALDVTLLTRTAGAFLAFHFGLGGPEPDKVHVVDGFEFPWPEGTGYRSELLCRFFLQQERTFVVLARPSGTVVVNREICFGREDRERHERFLRRLEAASPRDTDTRLRQATIARYFEEFPRETIRARLAYRIRQGHAPPEQVAAEEPDAAAAAAMPTKDRIPTLPVIPPDGAAPAAVTAPGPGARLPTPSAPALEAPVRRGEPLAVPDEEVARRSALVVAGLWPWVRRERLFAHAVPAIIGATALAGTAVLAATGPAILPRLIAGALLGLAAGILGTGLLSAHIEESLRRHVVRVLETSGGTVTPESLREAAAARGAELLPGRWGARLRRRLRRMLADVPPPASGAPPAS